MGKLREMLLANLPLSQFWVILLSWKIRNMFERYRKSVQNSIFPAFKIHLMNKLNKDDFDRLRIL